VDKITKLDLELEETQRFEIKGLLKVLSVCVQWENLVMNVVTDLKSEEVSVIEVLTVGSGQTFDFEPEHKHYKFLGSHPLQHGAFIWNIWYRKL
jgi:hypothetical protein